MLCNSFVYSSICIVRQEPVFGYVIGDLSRVWLYYVGPVFGLVGPLVFLAMFGYVM